MILNKQPIDFIKESFFDRIQRINRIQLSTSGICSTKPQYCDIRTRENKSKRISAWSKFSGNKKKRARGRMSGGDVRALHHIRN